MGKHVLDWRFLPFLVLLTIPFLWAKPTGAVSLTVLDAKVDTIFSQASFGSDPIDLRLRSWRNLPQPVVRAPSSKAEVNAMFGSKDIFSNTINLFVVDKITFCAQPSTRILGCALVGASGVILENSFLSGPLGYVLLAHEISHNLGLHHAEKGLMTQKLSEDVSLSAEQVSDIRKSNFVQKDSSGFFVDVIPYLAISPAVVPLPPTGSMGLAGLAGFVILARRKRRLRTSKARSS